MIDTHVHVVDFLQHECDPAVLDRLLTDGTLDGACVFGLPVKKKWATTEPERPSYYLDDNAPCSTYSLADEVLLGLLGRLSPQARGRTAPLLCGFDPTDLLAVEHVERMLGRYDGWRGVGEVLLRHDDLTELTYGENARAGHPALDPVLEVCAERDWPFSFHQDSSSAGRWARHEYVPEVVTMLERHPRVPFVWCHGGVGRRVHPEHQAAMLEDLLGRFPRLHVDLSWAAGDQALHDGVPDDDWAGLVTSHPDRFLLGSDAVGDVETIPERVKDWGRLLDRLPGAAADLVRTENARRLWGLRA